ncbi:CGNR zinc finger domain-containing protein [Amycolatopsis sp. 195334CR]|uniref:CGNR zinc finger domain-containing protein n=1 Tax=Amycolatopsis sp. 195334CR TaxID=2814588 RepID=UPI001A909B81|nr:CGNR zinc finger domain-containing protein [Amycolatopsis sp. 195334CR]MBN6036064.1 CGNR zinc finger domain-containing protein [Amycolatopsis sp. 195334CR]
MAVIVGSHNPRDAYTGDVRTTPEADVTLVLDFLNTLDVEEGTDALDGADSWRAWVSARDLRPCPVPEARAARKSLRALVGDTTAAPAEDVEIPVRISVTANGPSLVADSAVGSVLAAATRLSLLGEFSRVKICPADNCRWAFYDRSRNRSRSWCSMSACGNREKARAWRQRSTQS